jgi:hypothetical protein
MNAEDDHRSQRVLELFDQAADGKTTRKRHHQKGEANPDGSQDASPDEALAANRFPGVDDVAHASPPVHRLRVGEDAPGASLPRRRRRPSGARAADLRVRSGSRLRKCCGLSCPGLLMVSCPNGPSTWPVLAVSGRAPGGDTPGRWAGRCRWRTAAPAMALLCYWHCPSGAPPPFPENVPHEKTGPRRGRPVLRTRNATGQPLRRVLALEPSKRCFSAH